MMQQSPNPTPIEIPEPVSPNREVDPAQSPEPEAPQVPQEPGYVPDPGLPEITPATPPNEVPPLM